MKKLMILAAMLAMLVVAAVPAIAQVTGGLGQESESGDLETNFSVSNEGDYAFQCTPALQFGNTGNFNNGSSFVQYASELDDFEPGGIEFAFEPEQATDCSNTIQQSSAASGQGHPSLQRRR
jgi:hypothetical protein